MSDVFRTDPNPLPSSLALRVDQVCNQFEGAWRGPQRPRIETFLGDSTEPERSALQRELILLEVDYRRARGEACHPNEYAARFPTLDPTWLAEALASGPETPPAPAGRYRPVRFHARGGLGEVHIARDGELNREVALKRIQPRHAGNPESRSRFLREAEITARLQHPGIVPVYGLTHDDAGQPCYAMPFIEGESLKEAIQRFHDADQSGRAPGERRLALRQLLTRFVSVCHTIAYAHSRGVVHRDLKPGNIMLGSYGETVVVDWGLAKARPASPAESLSEGEALANPGGEPAADETRTGQALGTPAYMSPEQAAGLQDVVGPASDIYSLGATLYALLTGKPPFQEAEGGLLSQVRRGAFRPPRQVQPDVPRALDAVCRKAMAPRPEQRYATAQELGAELEHWLADEPVAAYPEPLPDRLRRWGRKHRTLVATAAALLLTAVLGLGLGLYFVNAERQQTEQARNEAVAAGVLARDRFRLALEAFNDMVFSIQNKLENRPGTHELRRELLQNAQKGLKDLLRQADKVGAGDSTLIVSHVRLGDVLLRLGQLREAEQAYQQGHALALELAAADPTAAVAQRTLSLSFNSQGDMRLRWGDSEGAVEAYQEGLVISQRLEAADPRNARAQRDLLTSFEKVGNVRQGMGDHKGALEVYQKGLDISQRLAAADPRGVEAQRDLARSYSSVAEVKLWLGDSEGALEGYWKGLGISHCLAAADPGNVRVQRDLARSFTGLGNVRLWLRENKDALEAYQNGLDLFQRLAAADPRDTQAQRDLAQSFHKLGDVRMQLGDSEGSLEAYQKSLAISQRLPDADPEDAQAQRDLAMSFNRLGDALLKLEDSKGALEAYQKSLGIFQRLEAADSGNARVQRDLYVAFGNLGDALLKLKDIKGALEAYQNGLDFFQRLADADPRNAQAQRDLMERFSHLGNLEVQRFDFAQARAWFDKARGVARKFHSPAYFTLEMNAFEDLVAFHQAAQEAVAEPTSARKLDAVRRGEVLGLVVNALLARKDHRKAVQAADLLAEYAARAVDLYDAACGHARCVPLAGKADLEEKYAARAMALLGQAIDKGFHDVEHMKKDSDLDSLRSRPDFRKLMEDLQARVKPASKE